MEILTPEERNELRNRHKQERDGRVRDRLKAILLYDKGWSRPKIAEALMIDEVTVRRHIQDYTEHKKIKPKNGGSQSKLNSVQTQALISHLEENTYVKASDICSYIPNQNEDAGLRILKLSLIRSVRV